MRNNTWPLSQIHLFTYYLFIIIRDIFIYIEILIHLKYETTYMSCIFNYLNNSFQILYLTLYSRTNKSFKVLIFDYLKA